MKNLIYLFQFFFIKILFSLIKILPFNIAKKITSFIFKIIGKLTNANKTAVINCKFVFPHLDEITIKKIVNKSWENIGITICEVIKLNKLFQNNQIVLKGLTNIENLKKSNQQAIFISIHQSNWEVLVPSIDRLNVKIGAVYRHINNIFLYKMILNIRKNNLTSKKNFFTPKGRQSAKDLLEALNVGFSILLLIDQKDSAGENVLFFNKKVKTQMGFLKIARKFNIPIIPIKNTRLNNGKIELNFLDPIFHNNAKISDNLMMENIHKTIEGWIIANPKQWFWQHKRFN